MLNINLKSRFENKTFWVSIVSAILLLLQQLHLTTLANYIPQNYADIINTIFVILTLLGITVDTSTPGVSDNTVAVTTISNSAMDTSASSKVVVDNPDNIQAIGSTVNSTSANAPQ